MFEGGDLSGAGGPQCPRWEHTSAAIDGELDRAAAADAFAHAERCADCGALIALGPAPSSLVGLSGAPLDGQAMTPRERRWLDGGWTRWLLLVAAVVIVVDGIPTYVGGGEVSEELHAARHLASWQIGFGVGILVAALMSRMSHAMLALAATFAALTLGSTVIDLVGGHDGPIIEAVHLVEVVAVFLLWRMAPTHLMPWKHRRAARASEHRADASL